MLTIKTLERIKQGAWLTLINGIYTILFGVVYMALMSFILKINFRHIEIVWQVFQKYNPDVNSMIVRLVILKGIFIIVIGIVIVYLSNYILKKKEKMAWVILFILGIIFWPAVLTMEFSDSNI